MKNIIFLLFNLISLHTYSQSKQSLDMKSEKKSDVVSFVTVLEMANATKEGVYMNGYVLNIDFNQGSEMKVSG